MTVRRSDLMERVGNIQQWGGTRLVRLEDGPEAGVRAVEFRTAAGLEFGVLVDRGFDISWFRHRGRSAVWHSPTGFIGPWFREVEGLGFLRTFQGGLVVTAGLDHILFPQVDPNDTYNYPGRPDGTSYGLHGRASGTPATLRGHGERWDGDTCTLYAEGEVRQTGALAENLVMRRRVEVDLFGSEVTWVDTIVNEGHYPTPHMLLYHMNLGAPLLDQASELVLPSSGTTWRTPGAGASADAHLEFHKPRAGTLEEAYAHDLVADDDGTVTVALLNRHDPAGSWGLQLTYDQAAFPNFLQWRYLDAGTYVMGFEPSTNDVRGRQAARDSGSLIILEPGQSREYRTSVAILDGAEACDAVVERNATLLERSMVR